MIDTSVQPGHSGRTGWSWTSPKHHIACARRDHDARCRDPGSQQLGDPYYDGPCPPEGSGKHLYEITIWALGTSKFPVPADMKATDLNEALGKVALGHASLTGSVTR